MAIICYKSFTSPLAIGFDLDDTLYDNGPVLAVAEQALRDHLAQQFPRTSGMTYQDWFAIRQQVITKQPALANDIGLTRIVTLRQGLLDLGYDEQQASKGAEQAMALFLTWRNTIDIASSTHQLLTQLDQRYRLFAISNGNVCTKALNLTQYFEFTLHANINNPMKPSASLFNQAQQRLGLSANQILYIGDHPVSDVVGATRAGWQSGWLNLSGKRLDHRNKPLQLPTFEFSQLTDLALL